MDFFDELDAISILERNSNRIEGMQMQQVKKMIKLYRQAREGLKQSLLMAPDNTFTEAKLKSALLQVEDGLKRLQARARGDIQTAQADFTEQGASDSVKEVSSMERHFTGLSVGLPMDAIIESVEPDNFLFNQFDTSMLTYNQGLRNSFQNVLGQNLLQQKTWSQSVFDMEQVFDAQEWMLARIVRTELHNIYNVSKMKGFGNIQENYLPDLKKTMYHPMDSRTGEDSIAMSRQDMVVPIDEPFRFEWKGKKYVFICPPNRPNDRAILIPYRKSWDNTQE